MVSLLKDFPMIDDVREIMTSVLQKEAAIFSNIVSYQKAFQQNYNIFYGGVPYCIYFMLIPL